MQLKFDAHFYHISTSIEFAMNSILTFGAVMKFIEKFKVEK